MCKSTVLHDDLSIWATNREGAPEEDMSYIEALMKLHTGLQINERKQKTWRRWDSNLNRKSGLGLEV